MFFDRFPLVVKSVFSIYVIHPEPEFFVQGLWVYVRIHRYYLSFLN